MRRHETKAGPGRCPEAMDLAAYLDGRAEARRRKGLENHFAYCPSCRRALLDLRRILAAPDEDQPAPEALRLARELAARLRHERQAAAPEFPARMTCDTREEVRT